MAATPAAALWGASDGRISRSYSTGVVQGFMNNGGLVGTGASFPVTNSFWNVTTSTWSSSTGGRGMNTQNLQTPVNFSSATPANGNVNPGWDAIKVWILNAGSYPQLKSVSPAP